MTRSNLLEILQIKVHQSGVFMSVFFRKKAEIILLIETCSCGKRIDCNKPTPCTIAMSEDNLHVIYDVSSDALPCVCLAHCQTSNLHSGIMVTLLTERNLAINAITHALFCFVQSDNVVKQTEIRCNVTILLVNNKISTGQKFYLVAFRLVNQKFVQVSLGTLERIKIGIWSQIQNVILVSVHLKSEQLGELRFAASYDCHALIFSSSETGEGWSMCQRKRSASLPVSTGVSLIGLAILILLSFKLRRKVTNKN